MKKFDIIKVFLAAAIIAAGVSANIDWDTQAVTINTAGQLKELASMVNGGNDFQGITVTLGSNIDLKGGEDNQWTPIGNKDNRFAGTFDGKGFVVSGVYINTESDYQGLFGFVGENGIIKNLGIAASYIKGNFNTGAMAGTSNGAIKNCYAAGNVVGNASVGGLAGTSNGAIISSYYDSEASGQSDEGKGAGMTTSKMKQQATYTDWDFNAVWEINAAKNNGYPYLRVAVSNISGVITSAIYNETKLLSGIAEPVNATNKTIVWSVVNGGAAINGNSITFTEAGQVTIMATIVNGLLQGSDYTKVFNITVAKSDYDMSGITFENGTTTYNGEAQGIEINGGLPDGVSVIYRIYNGNTFILTSSRTQVGEYTVTAIFSTTNGNYNVPSSMTAKLTIRAQDPTQISSYETAIKKYGILLERAVVSQEAKITVKTPEQAQINLVVYDNLGSVIFEANGESDDKFVWNLTNKAGRNVANGSYLIITEARGVSGKVYRYSAKVGIRR